MINKIEKFKDELIKNNVNIKNGIQVQEYIEKTKDNITSSCDGVSFSFDIKEKIIIDFDYTNNEIQLVDLHGGDIKILCEEKIY